MKKNNLVNANDVIRMAQPGIMIYASGEVFGGKADGEHYVSLMVREDDKHIGKLGAHPLIEIRAGVMIESEAIAVAVLLKVRGELYECWWNYHQPVGSAPFEQMQTQTILPVLFFSERGRERAVGVSNGMREFFQKAISLIHKRPTWSMADFDKARANVEARYPTVQALWTALGAQFKMQERVN